MRIFVYAIAAVAVAGFMVVGCDPADPGLEEPIDTEDLPEPPEMPEQPGEGLELDEPAMPEMPEAPEPGGEY